MAALPSNLISDFARFRQQVTESPSDYQAKTAHLSLLPSMKQLAASGNAMAQFRLAQAYPEGSADYMRWMTAAADQGVTNAMLAVSKSLLETKMPNDINKAAVYIAAILHSKDSFVKDQAEDLLLGHRLLQTAVTREMKDNPGGRCSNTGFFARSGLNSTDTTLENDLSEKPGFR